MVGKKTAMIREAVRKMEKNLEIIIVEFFLDCVNWPEYGISSFPEHMSREFLTVEFNLMSCKAIWSRSKLKIFYLFIVNTVTSLVCSIAIFLQFIQVISIFQSFLGNSNKPLLDVTAQSLFIVL